MALLVRITENGSSKYLEFNFRNCKNSDFTDNDYVIDEDMTRMFCPDINDNLKDLYRLKNNYANN